MRVAFCRGGYGALLAFSMSVFARWFAVHPVQAFVWLHAHRLPRLRLRSPPRVASGCARVGAYGCRGLARGRAPADSGRFRRKWAPISPWVLDFCAVFGGVVRRRLHRPGETPALGGVSGRFGLRNRPEVASGVRESLGERGGTVLVDELDAKLRPKPLRYVILLFKDSKVNKNGAQLIFSSQDVSTMRNDVFRRDEIWFAARAEGEASQLWSLADTRP